MAKSKANGTVSLGDVRVAFSGNLSKGGMRKARGGDRQADMFLPSLYLTEACEAALTKAGCDVGDFSAAIVNVTLVR